MDVADEHAADERLQFGVVSSAPADTAEAGSTPRAASRPASRQLRPIAQRAAGALRTALEKDRALGNGFLFIPVFLAVGAVAYFTLPGEPGLMPLLLGAAVLGGVVAVLPDRPFWRAVAFFCLMTLIGALAGKLQTWRTDTPMLGSEITTMLTGRVVTLEHQASGRVRLTLDVLATRRPELRYVPQRVRASARSVPTALRPGGVVEGVVRLMPPSGPLRPDSYDFAFKSFFDGIGANGFFLSNVTLLDVAVPAGLLPRFNAWIEGWRLRMAQHITDRIGGAEGAIAAALITGIRAGIPEEINEALRISGLYHVISISGLHMALVAGTVMATMRALFALSPSFSMRRPAKKYAALAALAATAFYLFVSGADIAAQRSFIMLAVMLVAILFDRSALTMRNLAISAIVLLLIVPHEIVGPSFQMSFAATAALVAAYSAWTDWRAGRRRRRASRNGPVMSVLATGARYASGLSMTSVIAGLATALFTAWHFQQVSPLGLFANLAAMPFVSVVVMPMAVLASVLMPFGLDGPALQAMGFGIAAMNGVALWLAERSVYDATGAIPLGAVLVLTAALALLTMSSSAVRWCAAPLVLAGGLLLAARDLPDVLVSEDARLVAVRLADGNLAVNRARPRAFTLENWQRALNATSVVKSRQKDGLSAELPAEGEGFWCNSGLCVVRTATGVVAHAETQQVAASVCSTADVIIIDDATARNPCAGHVAVITKRDLARQGSAEIRFGTDSSQQERDRDARIVVSSIRFSIAEPYRPWHAHRRFSREARGMPPWQRAQGKKADVAAAPDQ